MDKSSQLIFDFSTKKSDEKFNESDFILSSQNESAVVFLQKFFSQDNFLSTSIQSSILKGAKASGKTYLLNIFAKKYNAIFLDINDQKNPHFFKENHFYILEDFDEIKNDEMLLHLINSTSEAKSFLLLTAKIIPDFILPDLNSRIKNMLVNQIKDPENEMMLMLLLQGLSKRQLKLSDETINYIANNLKREYQEIVVALDKIESFCHENKKKLSLLDAKKLLS